MDHFSRFITALLLLCSHYFMEINCHGMLMEPPNRSSIWRVPEFKSYNATVNYDDNGLYCGGVQVLYEINGGNCGICGDAFSQSHPRDNEDGGMYGNGIIVRKYKPGQVIPIEVNLTTTHFGYFEIRLCATDDIESHRNQSCYDKHVLELVGYEKPAHLIPPEAELSTTTTETNRWWTRPPKKVRNTKYYVFTDLPHEYFKFKVRLPKRVKCKNCVMQWEYVTGNSWNYCDESRNGGKRGCGRQEKFRNCADIAIKP